jgi:acyl carrier protein
MGNGGVTEGRDKLPNLTGGSDLDSFYIGPMDRLITLVKQLLDPATAVPTPFPVELQLSDLGLSSLKMVNLMLSVEMEFDIMIPQGDITPENFHSVASIARLVDRTLAAVASG